MARRLRAVHPRSVQVSIEGSASTNDAVRGKGVLRRTVSALKHLAKESIPTVVSFTAHGDNFREFQDVARIARELGVAQVWADRLIPHGRGSSLASHSLSPDETREFFQHMYAARSEAQCSFCHTDISMGRALQFLVGGGTPYRCVAGENLVTVQCNGDLLPCRRMPIPVGNVTETTLTELYYTSELFQALRTHRVSEGCEGCRFSRQCRGGLRCLAYAVTGDPFAADPGCWLVTGREEQQAAAAMCAADHTS